MAGHGVLSACLSDLDQVYETALALFEASHYGLVWELREVLILHNEVMKIVAKVVSAGCASMAVKHAEETYLGPLDGEVLLAFRFQDVEDNRYAVLIIVSNNSLICISCVALYNATLLL